MVPKTQCVHTVSLMKQKTIIIINALTITTSGSISKSIKITKIKPKKNKHQKTNTKITAQWQSNNRTQIYMLLHCSVSSNLSYIFTDHKTKLTSWTHQQWLVVPYFSVQGLSPPSRLNCSISIQFIKLKLSFSQLLLSHCVCVCVCVCVWAYMHAPDGC